MAVTGTNRAMLREPRAGTGTAPLARRNHCDSSVVPITSLIEGEIIPRLLCGHPVALSPGGKDKSRPVRKSEAEAFADLPLALDADDLMREVEAYLDRGVSVESVFVDLLAPAARKLGEAWERDECDFVDVTMGLWRLQEVLREVALQALPDGEDYSAGRSILFTPMPGDDHSFGSLMVEEVFARAGWESELLIGPTRSDLLGAIGERGFDFVGLTLSNDCNSAAISDLITTLRSVSKNPNLLIIIGGRFVNADPSLAGKVGADGTAADAQQALALAERLSEQIRPLAAQQF